MWLYNVNTEAKFSLGVLSVENHRIGYVMVSASSSLTISSSGFKAVGRSTLTQCKRFERNENLLRAAHSNRGLKWRNIVTSM